MLDRVSRAAHDALAVVFPVDCAGCGAPDRALCAECRCALGGPLSSQRLSDGTRVVSALRYEGSVRRCILEFKENSRTDISRYLASPLLSAITEAALPESSVELCLIPATRRARRVRGYHPTRLLLAKCRLRDAPVLAFANSTSDQKRLSRSAREDNVRGSLIARGSLAGRRFIIVDDILTTGSTVREAARALRDAGAMVASAATLAFTPQRSGASGGTLVGARDFHRLDSYGG